MEVIIKIDNTKEEDFGLDKLYIKAPDLSNALKDTKGMFLRELKYEKSEEMYEKLDELFSKFKDIIYEYGVIDIINE